MGITKAQFTSAIQTAFCFANKLSVPKALKCVILYILEQTSGKVLGKHLKASTTLTVYTSLTFQNDGTAPASTDVQTTLTQPTTISSVRAAMVASTTDTAVQAALNSATIAVTGVSTTDMPTIQPASQPSSDGSSSMTTIAIAVPVAVGGAALIAITVYLVFFYNRRPANSNGESYGMSADNRVDANNPLAANAILLEI